MTGPDRKPRPPAKPEPNLRPLAPAAQRALADDLRAIADQLDAPPPANSH